MFIAALLLSLTCTIPNGIHISAPDPCWTEAHIEKAWPELEERVHLTRDTLERPYQPMPLQDVKLDFVEHPDDFFLTDGANVYGVFSPKATKNRIDGIVSDRDRIDYSRGDEFGFHTIQHEMGHYRYRVEMDRYGEQGSAAGYFDHGNDEDPVLQAINRLISYLYPMPHDYPYFPGLLGQNAFVAVSNFCFGRRS
jgi:hypothetical protein